MTLKNKNFYQIKQSSRLLNVVVRPPVLPSKDERTFESSKQ